ncbi:hypothetical protein PVAND_012357 [Polypedilum vanderplanki]|uniref:Odorant receptor n=1 Tax=Polypedilum vanderplanki TaxID=319348 RepID=A0A9J6CLB7_POLVA|nr:hypothetical protein PVAND_012357 [Polypedilum vanderplanki]
MEKLKSYFYKFFPNNNKNHREKNLKSFIDSSVNLLKLSAFDFDAIQPFDSFQTKLKVYVKIFIYWLIVIDLCILLIIAAISLLSTPYDLQKLTFGLPVVASSLMIVIKYFLLFIKKQKLRKILKIIEPFSGKLHEKYQKDVKFFGRFVKIYLMSLLSPLIVNISTPIVTLLTTNEKTFPLQIEFPLKSEIFYPFLLLWTFWNLTIAFIVFYAVDVLVYGLIVTISIEFKILRDEFEAVNSENAMNKLIDRHNQLLKFCNQLEEIFSPSFFYKFINSSFVICFTAFQCSTSEEFSQILVNMTICIANMSQIGLQCFFGQMLENTSEGVANGIYFCDWENFEDLRIKNSIILCIARAQKVANVTTIKFRKINFRLFAEVSL